MTNQDSPLSYRRPAAAEIATYRTDPPYMIASGVAVVVLTALGSVLALLALLVVTLLAPLVAAGLFHAMRKRDRAAAARGAFA